MTKMPIVVLDSLFDDLAIEREAANRRGWSLEPWNGSTVQLENAQIVLHVRTIIDNALFAHLRNCRVIGRFGTGLDTINTETASARKVTLVNVRDYCIPELTAQTLGLIFALTRGICARKDDTSYSEGWKSETLENTIYPIETIGIVGLGSIGQKVCNALSAIGTRVLATTSKGAETVTGFGGTKVDLPELLAQSDVVTLHLPLLPETERLVGSEEIGLMKKGSVLVNTARIGLLDERAIADALETGQLGGLGLDAQLSANSPINQCRPGHNVIVTPHTGWYSKRSALFLRETTVNRAIDSMEQLESKHRQ